MVTEILHQNNGYGWKSYENKCATNCSITIKKNWNDAYNNKQLSKHNNVNTNDDVDFDDCVAYMHWVLHALRICSTVCDCLTHRISWLKSWALSYLHPHGAPSLICFSTFFFFLFLLSVSVFFFHFELFFEFHDTIVIEILRCSVGESEDTMNAFTFPTELDPYNYLDVEPRLQRTSWYRSRRCESNRLWIPSPQDAEWCQKLARCIWGGATNWLGEQHCHKHMKRQLVREHVGIYTAVGMNIGKTEICSRASRCREDLISRGLHRSTLTVQITSLNWATTGCLHICLHICWEAEGDTPEYWPELPKNTSCHRGDHHGISTCENLELDAERAPWTDVSRSAHFYLRCVLCWSTLHCARAPLLQNLDGFEKKCTLGCNKMSKSIVHIVRKSCSIVFVTCFHEFWSRSSEVLFRTSVSVLASSFPRLFCLELVFKPKIQFLADSVVAIIFRVLLNGLIHSTGFFILHPREVCTPVRHCSDGLLSEWCIINSMFSDPLWVLVFVFNVLSALMRRYEMIIRSVQFSFSGPRNDQCHRWNSLAWSLISLAFETHIRISFHCCINVFKHRRVCDFSSHTVLDSFVEFFKFFWKCVRISIDVKQFQTILRIRWIVRNNCSVLSIFASFCMLVCSFFR